MTEQDKQTQVCFKMHTEAPFNPFMSSTKVRLLYAILVGPSSKEMNLHPDVSKSQKHKPSMNEKNWLIGSISFPQSLSLSGSSKRT